MQFFDPFPRSSADDGIKVVLQWMRLCCPEGPAGLHSLPMRLPIVVEPGADVERSYVVRGVVIGAVLAHAHMPARLEHVKFVVVRWPLTGGHGPASCTHTVVASTREDASRLSQIPFDGLGALLQSLRQAQVQVVVTTAHVRTTTRTNTRTTTRANTRTNTHCT